MNHALIFNVSQNPFLSRPLGGHRIAHHLRENHWDVEVIDWANWWSFDQLTELFKSRYTNCTKFIGFGHLFSMWAPVLEEFCAWIKKQYPHIIIISGSSVNPSFDSEHIDYYIQGYGEYAIEVLLNYLFSNGVAPKFNFGISVDKKIISAIHSYPAYPLSSLMVRYEDRDFIEPHEWLTVETSRGCMFNCAFCNFPVLGVTEDYTRDAEDFYNQLQDTYDRFGVTSYSVADETFNDRTEKITKFANAVTKLSFSPWFSGYLRADLLISRPADQEELLRMNFLGHFYGVESFNYDSARAIGKGMKSDRIKEGLINLRKYFESHGSKRYRGSLGFIVGLPYETLDSVYESFDWLTNNWQGHSFGMHPLSIPTKDSINKQSRISNQIDTFNYEIIPNSEIETIHRNRSLTVSTPFDHIIKSANRKLVKTEIAWKNNHMTIFDAIDTVSDILNKKSKLNFRPGCYTLSYNLTSKALVNDKLDMTYCEFDSLLNYSIDSYINKKLNI